MVTPNAPSESPLSAASLDATLAQQAPDEGAPREPGVGPRLGRFTILERIGAGNMGVVFTAYDDVLDRKIAVKVLRGGGEGASLRLLREAQAMARVAHPNVVTVHEVGTSLDQVYVAMEFIRGTTLQVWQREPGRAWPDIVDAYAQAGRGLQAAHAAGLIHRDFKPANAMIDADGRVRVLDFGLVRSQIELQQPLTDASASRHMMSVQLTQAGDVLGTPAYMSPEQIRGLEIGPAADQFSLCVSLYEGLYGALPFAGDSFAALFRSIQRHRLPDPPRNSKVPTWLRAVLLRGLHPVPEDRYPSIAALLRALGAGSAKRRRVGVGVGVGAVAAAALVGFLAARAQGPELCGGAEARLRGVWGPEQRVAVERSLSAAGPAFAAEVAPQVLRELESYVGAWTVAHRDACMAHSRGEQSDQLLDRRMVCLEQRKAALAAAVGVLSEKDEEVAREALRVVNDLPAIDRCNDVEVLGAEVAPPADPRMVAAVAEVRSELAQAETLGRAGKIDEAIAIAERGLQAAMRTAYRPIEAEALLSRSRLGAGNDAIDDLDDARITRAMLTAIDSGMDEVAAEAAATRVFIRGSADATMLSALDDVPLAEALARRLARPDAILGLLANNVGVVQMRLDRPVEAQRAFELALTRRSAALGDDDPELANTLANLGMVEPGGPDREAHLQRGLAILANAFGPGNRRTLDLRFAAVRRHLDPGVARELLRPGCEALERFQFDTNDDWARCLADLGHLSDELDTPSEAALYWQQANDVLRSPGRPVSPRLALTIEAAATLHRGQSDEGLEGRLRVAIADLAGVQAWWDRRDRAELRLALAELRGPGDEAISLLRAAIADFEGGVSDQLRDVYDSQYLARARTRLAAWLLQASPVAEEEIHQQILRAEAFYRGGGPSYAWRLGGLETLRLALMSRPEHAEAAPSISP